MCIDGGCDDSLVLNGIEGAGGIDESAARLQEIKPSFKNS